MSPMIAEALSQEWQAVLAPVIVAAVLVIFVARRVLGPKKQSTGCGGGCDCPVKPKLK